MSSIGYIVPVNRYLLTSPFPSQGLDTTYPRAREVLQPTRGALYFLAGTMLHGKPKSINRNHQLETIHISKGRAPAHRED
jgi:hypothetical protein